MKTAAAPAAITHRDRCARRDAIGNTRGASGIGLGDVCMREDRDSHMASTRLVDGSIAERCQVSRKAASA